jgi:predicted MFS family arabinose efflux permease
MSQQDSVTREKMAIFVIAAVQFVNVVDFMMVMPLGPDFAEALGIRVSHMGVLAGAYTLAAGVSGFLCSFFLDRIERRSAIVWSIVGLAIGTGAGAFAINFHTLLWARVLAGIFGGPTSSIGLAIISDLIPHQRRGAAIGRVMIGFSAASIFGVPIGLEVARIGGWNAPFIMVGLSAMIVAVMARVLLPELKGHITDSTFSARNLPIHSLLKQLPVWNSYILLFFVMMSGFLIFPNVAGYVQLNLKFPRDDMGQLYLVGGLASLAVMTVCGKLVDRFGSLPWFILGSVGFFAALFLGMYFQPPWISPYGLFVSFMVFGTLRNISMQTLSSKVPIPKERAGFMSLQSAVQHFAMAAGGIVSSRLLSTGVQGELEGIDLIVVFSGILIVLAVMAIIMLSAQVKHFEH